MFSVSELAWAAGLFEGEGTVRINALSKRNTGALIVSVVNCDEQIVAFFAERFGGRVKPATGLHGNRRPAWVWTCAARVAARFLRQIEPHLRTDRNKKRARAGILFQEGKVHRSKQGPGYVQEQWEAFMWLKHLNQRGLGPTREQ